MQPGLPLTEDDFIEDILRRKSGPKGTTPRIETDEPEILSGVYNGHTTGAPLAVIFHNRNTRSGDYKLFNDVPRPGHADYTASVKWLDFNDPRGGGHFSGRLTLPVVAAGVVAKKMCVCNIKAELIEVGGVSRQDAVATSGEENAAASVIWKDVLDQAINEGDSVGGIVECTVSDVPAGIGEPFFDSVESMISHAIFSIPGVRGKEWCRRSKRRHNQRQSSGIQGGIQADIQYWKGTENTEFYYRTDDGTGNSGPSRRMFCAQDAAGGRGNDCCGIGRPDGAVKTIISNYGYK